MGSGWFPLAPGITAPNTATHRAIFLQRGETFLAQGGLIDGALSRDSQNAPDIGVLRAGLLMGKVTSSGKYANSVLGQSSGVYSSGTTLATDVNTAAEIVRRIGTSGTFGLVGPPAASGVNRSVTVTFSNVNLTTGNITITALGTNEVQTLDFANSPSGTFSLDVVDKNGVVQNTGLITYSGTIGTLLTNLQAATDAVLATNAIVWSGSVVTAVAGTFSGTGYAGLPQALIEPTPLSSAGSISVTRTTPGAPAAFVTGSLICPTDGSQNIMTFIPDWDYGVQVTDQFGNSVANVDFPKITTSGTVNAAQLLPWPADTSIQTYILQSLNALVGGKYVFKNGPNTF